MNTTMLQQNVHLREKEVYSRPKAGWVANLARLYDVVYQAASSRLWNSVVIFGVAVAMAQSCQSLSLRQNDLRIHHVHMWSRHTKDVNVQSNKKDPRQ